MAYLDSSNVSNVTADIKTLCDNTYAKQSDIPEVPSPSSSSPLKDNASGSIGSSEEYARADHRHPAFNTLYNINKTSGNSNSIQIQTNNYHGATIFIFFYGRADYDSSHIIYGVIGIPSATNLTLWYTKSDTAPDISVSISNGIITLNCGIYAGLNFIANFPIS